MVPAMLPPPTPLKVLEIAAGVFEMRPALFTIAIFVGKLIQFLVCALITIFYGPQLIHGLTGITKRHAVLTWSVLGLLLVIVGIWFSRKLFAKNANTGLPPEDTATKAVRGCP